MKRKESIVVRMKETYKMWQLMCLLKEKQHEWARPSETANPSETPEEANLRLVKELIFTSRRVTDPEVLITELSIEYLRKYQKSECSGEFIHQWNKPMVRLSEVKSIVISCQDSGFVKFVLVGNNTDFLIITENGKRFATVAGFLKQIGKELSEFITDWQVAFYAILALVGAFNLGWLKTVTSPISPLW